MITLTHLGGVFASVMTGNRVNRACACPVRRRAADPHRGRSGELRGRRGHRNPDHRSASARRGALAALGDRRARCPVRGPMRSCRGLGSGGARTHRNRPAGFAAAAAAMGLQGAAMRGLGVAVTTTYLTGTLTGLVAAFTRSPRPQCLIDRRSPRWSRPSQGRPPQACCWSPRRYSCWFRLQQSWRWPDTAIVAAPERSSGAVLRPQSVSAGGAGTGTSSSLLRVEALRGFIRLVD